MYRACSLGTANEEKCVRCATSSEWIDQRDDLEPVQSSRNDGKDRNQNPDEGLLVYLKKVHLEKLFLSYKLCLFIYIYFLFLNLMISAKTFWLIIH